MRFNYLALQEYASSHLCLPNLEHDLNANKQRT